MSSARGRGNRDDDMTEYERQKWEQVARNKEKMDSLRLRQLSAELQPARPSKRTKTTQFTSVAAPEHHNLRPRPQRNNVEHANEQIIDDPDYEIVGEFLCDNEDLHSGTEKRNGRGITMMNDIFSRTADMPKLKVTVNEFGQPVGEIYTKFVRAIGCQVRKTLPVRFIDWRDVPLGKKIQVWDNLQVFFDVDEPAKKWFMDTAAKKWKDYKAHLRRKYFDETLTDEQLKDRLKNIVNNDDIDDLIKFWRSPECQARTERGKANRAKLMVHHTSGSISHACSRHNLGKALGRPPRRDEVYINTHTRKNGVPLREAAETIDKLKAIVEAQPELKDRTIQEGDAYAAICGAKEPRGRVRVLGLGPTPQEIGTPGLRALMSTRMQMEIFARQRAESKNRTLEQRIMELEEERIAQGRTNIEVLSQHGSNSRQYAIPTPEEHIDEAHNAPRCEEYDNYVENEDYDHYGEEEESLLPDRHATARSAQNITTTANDVRPCFANDTHVQMEESLLPARHGVARSAMNVTTAPTTNILPHFANDTHAATEESLLPPRPIAAQSALMSVSLLQDKSLLPRRHDAAHSAIKKTTIPINDVPPRFAHDNYVGMDVILFAMLRSDLAVARGTVISTNPNTMVGGEPLGKEFCEVVVNVVMKKDALLFRTYGGMQTMANALKMSIAWPYNKVKECKKKECKEASRPLKGSAGSAGHKSWT